MQFLGVHGIHFCFPSEVEGSRKDDFGFLVYKMKKTEGKGGKNSARKGY